MTDTANEQYWTTRQVAERLQVSEDALKKWFQSGKLRRVKVGDLNRVTETDLQAFIAESTKKADRAA